jgi:hypothetical protein
LLQSSKKLAEDSKNNLALLEQGYAFYVPEADIMHLHGAVDF